MDIVNECAPVPAPKLGEDLRRLILALHAKFLSSDGRSVDYDGIKEYALSILFKTKFHIKRLLDSCIHIKLLIYFLEAKCSRAIKEWHDNSNV